MPGRARTSATWCQYAVPVPGNLQRREDPADGGRADPVTELEQLALDPHVSQPRFSLASRSMSEAISALTGGRSVRFG